MNRQKSHHKGWLRVTPAAPLTRTSAFEPRQMSFSFTILQSEQVKLAGARLLRSSRPHAKVFFFHPSGSTNQPFYSRPICIQCSRILPVLRSTKAQIFLYGSPVPRLWNCLEFGLSRSRLHAVMNIYSEVWWRKTCYYLMTAALIWLLYNAQALKSKFSRDD